MHTIIATGTGIGGREANAGRGEVAQLTGYLFIRDDPPTYQRCERRGGRETDPLALALIAGWPCGNDAKQKRRSSV